MFRVDVHRINPWTRELSKFGPSSMANTDANNPAYLVSTLNFVVYLANYECSNLGVRFSVL